MMNCGYLEIEEVLHILSTIREWKEKCTFPSFRILDTEKLSTPFILSEIPRSFLPIRINWR